MKRIAILFIIAGTFMLSGCTVAHFYYVRNLSDEPVDVTFVFASAEALMLRDSLYVPYSATSHLVKKNTCTYMTDSLKAKKISLTEMKLALPSGSMIMLDKNTLRKMDGHHPDKMKITRASKGTTDEVYFLPKANVKSFKEKGTTPHLLWYDIY